MIYKYNFSILGDNFYPEKIIDKIQGDFLVESFYNPTDKIEIELTDVYGFGGMYFWH